MNIETALQIALEIEDKGFSPDDTIPYNTVYDVEKVAGIIMSAGLSTPPSSATSAEVESSERALADYGNTVRRVWEALGNPSYESLNGKTIWEVVAQLRTQLAEALKERDEDTKQFPVRMTKEAYIEDAKIRDSLRTQLAAMTEQAAKGEADTKRLDWLNNCITSFAHLDTKQHCHWAPYMSYPMSIREAIDAALQSSRTQET